MLLLKGFLAYLAIVTLLVGTSSAQQEGVQETIQTLAGVGSRVVGYPGYDEAAAYVEARLRASGAAEVRRDTFPVVVPVDLGGSIGLPGQPPVPMWGLWPNGARTPTLPQEGLRAPMIYAGKGDWGDFNGREIDGRVVLLDFSSGANWLNAALLGARAVVFIAPDATSLREIEDKVADVPLDLPRFWVEPDAVADLRRRAMDSEVPVEMFSRMEWQQKTAWNIWARFPGNDPELSKETLLVSSYFDANSLVPARAPGAESAVGMGALLALADRLGREPTPRSLILLASGAHFQDRQGIGAFLQRYMRRHPYYRAQQLDSLNVDLFIGLDLSSQSSELAVWDNASDFTLKRFFAPFGRRFVRYAEAVNPSVESGREVLANGISPIRGMDWSTYMPGGLRTAGQRVFDAGHIALTLATIFDGRQGINSPLDQPSRVQYANAQRQSDLISGMVVRAARDDSLLLAASALRSRLKDSLRDVRFKLRTFPRRSQVPDRPISGLVTMARPRQADVKGVRSIRYALADSDGVAQMNALPMHQYAAAAYAFDGDGAISYAPDLSKRAQGHTGKPTGQGLTSVSVRWDKPTEQTFVLFPTRARPLYGLIEPRSLRAVDMVKVLDGRGVEPRQYGYVIGQRAQQVFGVLFGSPGSEEENRLKLLIGDVDQRQLLLNSSGYRDEEEARGRGFLLAHDELGFTALQAARDMWNLDEARIRSMRRHAIENARIDRLHARVADLIEGAERARNRLDWERYVALSREALGIEARAYPEVLGVLNDVIKGMVFFLALVVPAAFFGERLLFAASDIRRQLLGFFGLLLIVWMAISSVHPAFEIAHPLVVLLAFAIMALAAFVLFMIIGRFRRYVDENRRRLAQVHDRDISRLSAAYSAFMLGISNMRRRRLRTGLTLATLVLLTFTLLSFATFDTGIRFVALNLDRSAAYEGVLLRTRGWDELGEPLAEYARSHFARGSTLTSRLWYTPKNAQDKRYIVVDSGTRRARALGLLGLGPAEVQITGIDDVLLAGRFFTSSEEKACLLSEEMASELGIARADVGSAQVEVFGRSLRVVGLVHAEKLNALRDLDDESLTPADFQMSAFQRYNAAQQPPADERDNLEDIKPFFHLDAARVLIASSGVLRDAGGSLRSLALVFDESSNPQKLVEDFLLRIETTLFVGRDRGDGRLETVAYSSFGMTSIQGMGALVIPALIAALIVLNAMMGAVYERFREIGIYSSVGLAPVHISLLFIAEACVYAVLGAALGYLMGQGVGRILLGADMLSGLTLNYSSTAAITSAVVVMLVVLLSTLYPARLAARAAVPDVIRRWEPEPPTSDLWRFRFPFMVGASEVVGMSGFLHSYFRSFSAGAVGHMHADRVQIREEDGRICITFDLWLAPFDLGVSQRVELTFVETDAARMYAMDISLQRLSGERFYWQRLNGRFLNALRKQLLIWHALEEEVRLEHRRQAEALLEEPEDVVDVEEEVTVVEEAPPDGRSPFTWKGLAVGAAGALAVGMGAPYGVLLLKGSYMARNSSSPAAIFLFFLIVFFGNALLGGLRRTFALTRADLVLVYSMLLMAVAVPTQAFVGYLIPVISGLYYYATPENRWGEIFFPYVERWLAPSDMEAIRQLHEGAPGGQIPWQAWFEPLGAWYAFFIALSFLMICMSSILHRQWAHNERLAYPMVELPLRMIEGSEGPFQWVLPLFRRPALWVGFAVAFMLPSLAGLHHYMPAWPDWKMSLSGIQLFGTNVYLPLNYSFAWIGFFYLVNLDISLSIWVFYILGKVQENVFKSLGIASTEQLSLYSFSQTADLTHQSMGACLVFVLYSLWVGRHHLVAVWRKAWTGEGDLDDSGELLSYRTAVFGFLGSLAFVAYWLWASGIPLIVLPTFLATSLLFYVFVTRVVAAAGVPTARSPMIAAFVVFSGIGSSIVGAKGLVAMTFTYIWQSEMRLFPMIACANSLKLADSVKGPKGRLFWGMMLAIVVALGGATWIILDMCYTHGGINLHDFFMRQQAQRTFADMARVIVEPQGPVWRGWLFTGIGGAIEGLLMWGHHRFYWWPLHPLGFVISIGWLTGTVWFSVFIAWLSKSTITRIGGALLYERLKPFFLGLILGEAVAGGFWLIVDYMSDGSLNEITIM